MIQKLLSEVSTIYIAYGVTDFRKQIPSLCAEVMIKFNLNPCNNVAFMFCNRKRNKNGTKNIRRNNSRNRKLEEITEKNTTIENKNSEIKSKNIEISGLKEQIENQKLQINWFNRYVFGQKKETLEKPEENIVGGTQCSILGVPEYIEEVVKEETEKITVYRKKKNTKNPSGIKKAALKDAEIVTEEYTIEDEKANCPECGAHMQLIGKEIIRQEIEYIPAQIKLKNYVRGV